MPRCTCPDCAPTRRCRCGAHLGYSQKCLDCRLAEADADHDRRKDERAERDEESKSHV